MQYNTELLIRRLQESGKRLITEQELLQLAMPEIKQVDYITQLVKIAIDKGFTGSYTISEIATRTTLSRQTIYRWDNEGILQRDKNGKIDMVELYQTLKTIKKRSKP